jgi:Zn-dependent protease with chaperone function
MRFKRLEKQIINEPHRSFGHRLDSLINTGSIIAILLFAVDIYGLNMSFYIRKITLFRSVPSLEAFLFLCLFIFYMSVIWGCAYEANRKLYISDYSSRLSYILSNISFCIPVVMPWLLLSVIADIINLLPFDAPKYFLSTTGGELIFFISFLIIIAVFGPVMIQKLWRCRPVEEGKKRSEIEEICKKAGVGFADILYWPIFGSRMITAGVMGLIKRFRYILVTKSLLSLLEPEEVEAVIAHEAGHIKRNHLVFYLLFFLGYMLLAVSTFDLVIYSVIYAKPFYRFMVDFGISQPTIISISYGIAITAIFLVYFRFIFGYFMRNFERQADTYVYSFFKNAGPLISTFEKIADAGGGTADKPNWHHFSIRERIDFLKKCDADNGLIRRHDDKIKKSMAIYLAGFILTGALGYSLNFGEKGKIMNDFFAEKIILGKIEDNPGDPELPAMLGDLYYSLKYYDKAKSAYEKTLSIAPDNPKALNNLAWLYATCEDNKIRNTGLAVRLAEKAVKIEETPQILDTLAESYYAAGRYKEAVETGKKALLPAGHDRSYYEKQLAKFMKSGE